MPKHLGIDVNVVSGTVTMEGTKTAKVMFVNSTGNQVAFNMAPRITLTVVNSGSFVPFKTSHVKTGNLFTGFNLGFQNNVTCEVEWVAQERM